MENETKGGTTKTGGDRVKFRFNRHGGLSVDRDSLHASSGYARQVAALDELHAMRERGTSDCCEREGI